MAIADIAAPVAKTTGAYKEKAAGLALIAAPMALLVVLVLLPTVAMVWGTFQVQTDLGTRLGIDRYLAFFADGYSMANLRYTLIQTLASCLTALSLSLGIALYLRFSQGRIATMIHALSLFPLFVPSVVISYALVRFMGPNGLLQLLLEQIGFTHYRTPYLTPFGPFIAFVWENLPLPVLVISAGLAQVSDHAIEAARDLGARAPRILFQILLPQLRRSLLIAFALSFLGVVGSFTVPYLLGPPAPEMLGVFMQRTLSNLRRPEEAQVQAVIMIIMASVVSGFYIFTMLRSERGSK
jgi:ABC-type spermidine/putrescine transport system permease subunit I